MCVLVAPLCMTLCDLIYCSLPGSSVHGIRQQVYWSGLPFSSPVNLPYPGVLHSRQVLYHLNMSSLEKCVFESPVHFFYLVGCFSDIELHQLLVYFGAYSLSAVSCAIVFSHSEHCLFTSFFAVQKLLNLIRSHLFLFLFPLF